MGKDFRNVMAKTAFCGEMPVKCAVTAGPADGSPRAPRDFDYLSA